MSPFCQENILFVSRERWRMFQLFQVIIGSMLEPNMEHFGTMFQTVLDNFGGMLLASGEKFRNHIRSRLLEILMSIRRKVAKSWY